MELSDVKSLLELSKLFLIGTTSHLDPFTKHKGKIVSDANSVTLLSPKHIQFAKYGRGPGKKPPLENILKFVREENIKFEGTDERGTAFAIQASIGKKGTIGYTPNAPNAIQEALDKEIKEYFGKLSNLIKVTISNQVKDILEEEKLDNEYKI